MPNDIISIALEDAHRVRAALDYIIGEAADNSCSDPDCCGGPYYDAETVEEYEAELLALGIRIID